MEMYQVRLNFLLNTVPVTAREFHVHLFKRARGDQQGLREGPAWGHLLLGLCWRERGAPQGSPNHLHCRPHHVGATGRNNRTSGVLGPLPSAGAHKHTVAESRWPGPVPCAPRPQGGDWRPWSWGRFLTRVRVLLSLPDGQGPGGRRLSGSPDSPLQPGFPDSRPWPRLARALLRFRTSGLLPGIQHLGNEDGAWRSACSRVPLVS